MRKISKVVVSLLILFQTIIFLASCGEDVKIPTNNYEKVKFAFNGVERSLKNSSRLNSYTETKDLDMLTKTYAKSNLMKKVSDSDLETIYNSMSVEKETNNPEFKYDEPPMIQFQYMKALYEEVGTSFNFDTKYSYTLTGEIYYDFKTRNNNENSELKNQYTMLISILINIDSNDLITAEVSFDMTYVNGDETHHQKRYSKLLLDYDMNDKIPTYNLAMIDIDDLLDYKNEDEKYISAEYDFVNVKKGTIQEWRKFGICTKEALSNYHNNDFVYKYSVLRAYKESKVYRIENEFKKDINLKTAVINGLGFISELESMKAFYSKESIENEKIKAVVNKFNSILGKDIVNSFVYTGATEKWEKESNDDPSNLFLRITSEKNGDNNITIYEDVSLNQLFSENGCNAFSYKGSGPDHLSIYLKNGEDDTRSVYNDLTSDDLNIKVRSKAYSKTDWIDISNNKEFTYYSFSSIISESGFIDTGSYDKEMTLEFDVSLKSNPNVKLQSNFSISLIDETAYNEVISSFDLANKYLNSYIKIDNPIPELRYQNVLYAPSVDEGGMSGRITLSSNNDLNDIRTDYINDLKKQGYVENSFYSTYTTRIDDDYLLVLTIYSTSKNDGLNMFSVKFEIKEEKKQEKTITEAIKELINNEQITIPDFVGDYEYSVEENTVRIKSNDPSIVSDYIASFERFGFMVYEFNGTNAAVKYGLDDETLYRIRDLGNSISVEKVEGSFTLVGDFNGWEINEKEYNFVTVSAKNEELFLEMKVSLQANMQFKIVKNHSWNNGGYGFGIFDPSEYKMYFSCGENNNFVTIEAINCTIKLRIAMDYYSSEPSIDLLMLEFEVE